ncbi:TetR family transcriptional regulator [Georgenia ruanii]|uniref:TetR family transcriptional regulator n=2 Tax=Georgenia ruanii TaxID=348442 RepID=A0A7J9V0V4_9MICO|nr:TetR family transcriptional regulator [Georgenia ruanii]
MAARAESTAATGERILASALVLFWERPTDQISLADVAARAGVSVQTVIRRFGGKEGLFEALADRERRRIVAQRDAAPAEDPVRAVEVLFDHYEDVGDKVLRLLEEASRVPGLRAVVEEGRRYHRAWCARVFAPALTGRHGTDRDRRLAQLVAVCDVYMWKLLRRDAGLSRRQAELAVVELLDPLLE